LDPHARMGRAREMPGYCRPCAQSPRCSTWRRIRAVFCSSSQLRGRCRTRPIGATVRLTTLDRVGRLACDHYLPCSAVLSSGQ
jgi:hypothetical protein